MDMSLSKLRELVMDRDTWCTVIHGVTKSQKWLSNWTELKGIVQKGNIITLQFLKDPFVCNMANGLWDWRRDMVRGRPIMRL